MKTDFAKGNHVVVRKPDRPRYTAVILKVGSAKAKIEKESGKKLVVSLRFLRMKCKTKSCDRSAKSHGYCKICFHKVASELPLLNDKRKDFKHYGIDWNKEHTHFKFATDNGLSFYGWYRKTKVSRTDTIVHAIDIFAKRDDRDFTLEPIIYAEGDPRENLRSLDADILAATTKWYTMNLHENVKVLDRVQKIAEHPRIHIKRMETLDRVILKLREFRDTAIRVGGTRLFELKGDNETEPVVHVVVNLTMQAMGLKGKVPSLRHGAVFDAAVSSKREVDRRRGGMIDNIPDKGNVQALVKQLRASTDPVERRQIRAMLRKMGHKGGSRTA